MYIYIYMYILELNKYHPVASIPSSSKWAYLFLIINGKKNFMNMNVKLRLTIQEAKHEVTL